METEKFPKLIDDYPHWIVYQHLKSLPEKYEKQRKEFDINSSIAPYCSNNSTINSKFKEEPHAYGIVIPNTRETNYIFLDIDSALTEDVLELYFEMKRDFSINSIELIISSHVPTLPETCRYHLIAKANIKFSLNSVLSLNISENEVTKKMVEMICLNYRRYLLDTNRAVLRVSDIINAPPDYHKAKGLIYQKSSKPIYYRVARKENSTWKDYIHSDLTALLETADGQYSPTVDPYAIPTLKLRG